KQVWRDYCYNKTVRHKCGEWVNEYVPVKVRCVKECREVCFDPCTCRTTCGRWKRCNTCDGCNSCENSSCEMRCKRVWKDHSWCEQVPCTRKVKETIHEKVPYTVCRKVPYTVVKKVPYTTQRCVRGAYVDDKGVAYDEEGPGRTFKEGASVCTKTPYTVCRQVSEIVKKQIPYTVCRQVCGAYVDEKGVGHDEPGPGRTFKEGAQVCRDVTTTSTRMVRETQVHKVPYTVYQTVSEDCVRQVPVRVCKMVPTTVKKCVPVRTCVMKPCTVHCRVPYTTCE